ncbi:MAG: dihydrofolate reductase family protein [Flammeovirgaceae bacterium]|nr:dihydrofolate reductase family protein [Flammeovirgaceae bacterium]
MRKIIYYVATSIDGFISGENEDISGFVQSGDLVDYFLNDLQNFDTVIMGRKTYEFGYKFGLQPGQPAYPHMWHFIFSDHLKLENADDKVKVCRMDLKKIKELKNENGTAIYLCGGGEFAGWLLENEMIDELKLKVNPLILSSGVKMFGNNKKQYQLDLIAQQNFNGGLQIDQFKIYY